MKDYKKLKERGITLIALVVSIILLIILAGVSLNTIFSENGLIKRTMTAGEKAQIENERERLNLELVSKVTENKGIMPSIDEFLEHLIEKGIIIEEEIIKNEDGSADIETDTGFDATLRKKENGEIEIEVNGVVKDEPPEILDINFETTTSSIKVRIKARRASSYKIEYKEKDKEEYIEKSEGKDKICLIDGLVQNKTYTIKVTAKNDKGEVTEEKNAMTVEVPTGEEAIEIGETEWDSNIHKASKKISKKEDKEYNNYKIQYAINEENNYITVEEGNSITIPDLEVDSVIYARLVDANNNGGKSLKTTIADITNPEEAKIIFDNNPIDAGTQINVTVIQTDNQSGVNISKCKWVCTDNKEEIGTDDSKLEKYTEKFENESGVIPLREDVKGTFYIHVLTEDNVGNRKETISEELTVILNNITLKFNTMGGNSISDETRTYGEEYGKLPVPKRTGYNFNGWYTESTGGTKITETIKIEGLDRIDQT